LQAYSPEVGSIPYPTPIQTAKKRVEPVRVDPSTPTKQTVRVEFSLERRKRERD